MKINWLPILDPSVLKVGMYVKTCLDGADVSYVDDDVEEINWFTGYITEIAPATTDETRIKINRDDAGLWNVYLYKDNLDCFMIKIDPEWDD